MFIFYKMFYLLCNVLFYLINLQQTLIEDALYFRLLKVILQEEEQVFLVLVAELGFLPTLYLYVVYAI